MKNFKKFQEVMAEMQEATDDVTALYNASNQCSEETEELLIRITKIHHWAIKRICHLISEEQSST